MMRCDLCGVTAVCLHKVIECKEFNVCETCWGPLAAKLTGKGCTKACFEELRQRSVRMPFEDLEEYEEVVY